MVWSVSLAQQSLTNSTCFHFFFNRSVFLNWWLPNSVQTNLIAIPSRQVLLYNIHWRSLPSGMSLETDSIPLLIPINPIFVNSTILICASRGTQSRQVTKNVKIIVKTWNVCGVQQCSLFLFTLCTIFSWISITMRRLLTDRENIYYHHWQIVRN